MRAGRLNKRIEFIETTETRDAGGGVSEVWSVYRVKWANWKPLKATEKVVAEATENPLDAVVTIRFDSTITAAMRIRKDKAHYEIQGIVNLGEKDQWHEITVHEMRQTD